MFSCLRHIACAEQRLRGASLRQALTSTAYERVRIDVRQLSAGEIVQALPAIRALVALNQRSAFQVDAPDEPLARLAVPRPAAPGELTHQGPALACTLRREDPEEEPTLEATTHEHRLEISPRPSSAAWGHPYRVWTAGAWRCGLAPSNDPPKLARSGAFDAGLAWLRRRLGRVRGPVMVGVWRELAPGTQEAWAHARSLLRQRMGGVFVHAGDGIDPDAEHLEHVSLLPGVLRGAALCVGNCPDATAVAAAIGVPTLRVHEHEEPALPRPCFGLEPLLWHLPQRTQSHLDRTLRFVHAISVANLVYAGELLAAARWPWDRVARLWQ